MKSVWTVVLGLVAILALAVGLQAADKNAGKPETLKGKLVCGKCTLHETDACANVLQVKEGDKTVNYYLDDKGKAEKYHKGICPPNSEEEATVTGTVSEEGGKKHIKPTKVEAGK